MDELDAALGGLRAAGWPAPEDPDGDDDAELDGRDLICDRLLDEVGWLRQCAGWLTHLRTKGFPSAVNLGPEGDRPERAHVVTALPRVAAILNRIAADVDELARAHRVADLDAAAVLGDRRAERRRRAAEPDLDFREFCRRSKLPQSERSWDLFAAERYRRGETGIRSYEGVQPVPSPPAGPVHIAPCREAVFSKLDALTRFLTPFLPAPHILRCRPGRKRPVTHSGRRGAARDMRLGLRVTAAGSLGVGQGSRDSRCPGRAAGRRGRGRPTAGAARGAGRALRRRWSGGSARRWRRGR
jgi:hypothetical protein